MTTETVPTHVLSLLHTYGNSATFMTDDKRILVTIPGDQWANLGHPDTLAVKIAASWYSL